MSYTWTDPTAHVYAVGEAVTAGTLNTYVQQNLAVLGQFAAATVAALQTTASLSYTDLATVGPSVTINTMTTAIVDAHSYVSNNTAADGATFSIAVSGATTVAASDAWRSGSENGGTASFTLGGRILLTGLTPGANTFTMKFRAVTGGTASFALRFIAAEAGTS